MRNRNFFLKSGASAFAFLAATATGQAAATVSGPATSDPYTNAESDIVTINADATIRANATTNDSFFNGIAMSNAAGNLVINDSTLLGDIVNTDDMISTAGTAVQILNDSQVFGELNNSGLIDGNIVGVLLSDDSTLAGGLTNGGQITAGSTAILVNLDSELLGGIYNSGGIDAGVAGIAISGANAELRGGITNAGTTSTISGSSVAAILLSGSIHEGGITNQGQITGQTGADGIRMTAGTFGGDIVNQAYGVIEALGTSDNAITISAGTFNGSISNSGTISADATDGVAIRVLGTTGFNGGITNTATGLISGDVAAISLTNTSFVGSIVNAGDIASANGRGIVVSATAFTGNINNQATGHITAFSTAISITSPTFTGSITNAGTITSATTADAIIVNAATFTGNLTNSGTINAGDDAVVLTGASFVGNVTNSGTINSGGDGILVETGTTETGSIANSGLIQSTAARGVAIDGVVTGTLTNQASGTIRGAVDGIEVNGTVTGGIANAGTIIGETFAAVDVSGADAAHTITQTAGLIRGGTGGPIGIAMSLNNTFADTVNANGGIIDGNIVGDASDIDDITMNPTSSFVYLRGTASDIDQFNKQGAGNALLGAASRGATGTNAVGVTVNAASMTNSGTGRLYIDDNTQVNLTGAFAQTAGTLEYFLTPDMTPTGFGQIAAGSASLGGSIAAYINPAAFAAAGGTTFTYTGVITGTTSGTFTNAASIELNALFFEGEADVQAGAVDIILTRLAFGDASIIHAPTQNQAAIADALETIYGNGGYGSDFEDLFAHLFSLPAGSEHDVEHIYDELGGAEHADVQEVGLRLNHGFQGAVGGRLKEVRATQAAEHHASLRLNRYAEADPIVASDAHPAGHGLRGSTKMGLWLQGFGDWTEVDGDEEAVGYEQDTQGIAGGFDVAVTPALRTGAAVGWSTADAEFVTPGDETEVDAFHAAVYAAFETGQFYADAIVGFALQDVSTSRSVELGFDTFAASANYDATGFDIHGEAGWMVHAGMVTFEPFAALAYAHLSSDDFQETGADMFNLFVDSQTAETLSSSLGARINAAWTDGGVRYLPSLEVAWRHEFLDERQSIVAAFEEDPSTRFRIVSSAAARDSAVVKARFGAELSQGIAVFMDYNGLYNTASTSHGAAAGVRASW
jgi:outer membrane autotransporter protein